MECRPLDITVLAAKGLKNVNLLSKMDVYVVATLTDAAGPRQTPQKTPVDQDAGTSPQWNFHMKFTLDEAAVQMDRLALVLTIMSDRALGDKVIGEVRVPLKELLDSPAGAGKSEKTASYVVLTPKGKKKGSLDFSYRFGDKYTYSTPEPVYAAHPAPVKGSGEPAMAYPAAAAGAGSSSAYAAYPPQGYAQPGYAYPPQYSQSHGYPQQYPPQAYGYQPAVQRPPKKSGGSKMGLGLAGGLLGGLLIGDMISDAGDMGGYDGGFDGGFDF